MEKIFILLFFAVVLLTLLYTVLAAIWIERQPTGSSKMGEIAKLISEGARSFLKTEYQVIAIFVGVVTLGLTVLGYYADHTHWMMGLSYLLGAFFSAFSGFIGMKIATKANVRTAKAAGQSLRKAFQVAFTGGSVMGMGVVGLALLGLGSLLFLGSYLSHKFFFLARLSQPAILLEVIAGFALGAETIALFARVSGGIYTKAADVGADLVGKTEAGIPEDDPRNPATIADNVGDNVGDVAGMGADLFGSYVSTIIAAMLLGCVAYQPGAAAGSLSLVLLPLYLGALGTAASLLALFFVRLREGSNNIQMVLNIGNTAAVLFTGISAYPLIQFMLPGPVTLFGCSFTGDDLFITLWVGLLVGLAIGFVTAYFTTAGNQPVNFIIQQSLAGPATNMLAGLSVGMLSTVAPTLLLVGSIWFSYHLAGFYGVALAAVGMMATTAIQLSIDAFGPIADNAGGIAEMSGLPQSVRAYTDKLDAVGNTTAAMGKGFAIASAALTSVALFAAFVQNTPIQGIDIYQAPVLGGLLLGGMVPFFFSSLAIGAVGKAAQKMVEEVRRQFRELPGLMEGKTTPAYDRCIAIATYASLYQMWLPAFLALVPPILLGIYGGAELLGAYVGGVTISGVAMALFQCNAGGAWDNAKKSFEEGITLSGKRYEKGSEAYKAAVIGDTVGDPFKDTSGPAMNILIKLTAIVALLLAPYLT